MTKEEVTRFYAYLQDLYRLPGMQTQEAYEEWCRAFENVTFDEGKQIVENYSKENTDKPLLPILKRYRDDFFNFKKETWNGTECNLCNRTGAILVEKFIVTNNESGAGFKALYVYRCKCPNGIRNYPTVPQISNDVVRGKHRDISNIWRVDQPSKRYGDSEKVDAAEVREMLAEVATQGEI